METETLLTQGNLVAIFNKFNKEYTVYFEIKPTAYQVGWSNIIHLTIETDILNYGDRNPSVWLDSNATGRLYVCSALNSIFDNCEFLNPVDVGNWSSVKISQENYLGKYMYSIQLNGANVFNIENTDAREFSNIKVYISDPWYQVQPGFIRNVKIINGNLAFWTAWSTWSSCNVSYGYGFYNRTRMCNSSNAVVQCFGINNEVVECFVNHTYEAFWTAWSTWSSCNVSYGYGFYNRTRMCNSSNAIEQCYGNSTEMLKCSLNKTYAGNFVWNVSYSATIESNIVTMNLSIPILSTYTNIEFEIFLPSFLSILAYNVGQRFVRTDGNRLKFSFNGSLIILDAFNYSFTATFNDSTCPLSGLFTLEVPLMISFQVKSQARTTLTKLFRKVVECLSIPKSSVLPNILKESYGCGIYWDGGNKHIYVCMNQYSESTRAACYYSNNDGFFWSGLDITIGSVLGHHSMTKELYAIHRNRKTYMVFHSISKKWLTLSNQDYDNNASRFIDSFWRRNLESESIQIYTLGPNQWLGNQQGLYFRKLGNDSWVQRVRWKR